MLWRLWRGTGPTTPRLNRRKLIGARRTKTSSQLSSSKSFFCVLQYTGLLVFNILPCLVPVLLFKSEVGIKTGVSDPDWIRIQMGQRIRI
jgi:hypothetical protein